MLFELIAFYSSTLLCLTGLLSAEGGVLGFTLSSSSSSLDPELSFRWLDWHLLMIFPGKRRLVSFASNVTSVVSVATSTVWERVTSFQELSVMNSINQDVMEIIIYGDNRTISGRKMSPVTKKWKLLYELIKR